MSTAHSWVAGLRHHVLVAWLAASALVMATDAGLLQWLDTVLVRVAAATELPWSAAPAQPGSPRLVLVGDEVYERTFNQASPLDRVSLGKLIEQVGMQCPAVLAIDIDLSPAPGEPLLSWSQGPDSPGAVLAKLRQACAGTRLLLVAPLPVGTAEGRRNKADWMNDLCASSGLKAELALPSVLLHQGVAVRYDAARPTLGVVAARQTADLCKLQEHQRNLAVWVADGSFTPAGVAEQVSEHMMGSRFLQASAWPENAIRHELRYTALGEPEVARPGLLRNQVVFLGLNVASVDQHTTAFGLRAGVMLHAAAFETERKRHAGSYRPSHSLEFLLEVLIGTALGCLFHATWGAQQVAQQALVLGRGPGWPARYFRARAWLVGNLVLVGLLFWLSTLGVAAAYQLADLWPHAAAPMVLGLFVKAWVAAHAGHGPNPQMEVMRLERWAAVAMVALGTVLVLGHDVHGLLERMK